ncbi:MAG: hypothetical protein IJE27_07400, partial [Anaerotignum sp.]|nr:hypothetical protein [Anaerotignum sp.]
AAAAAHQGHAEHQHHQHICCQFLFHVTFLLENKFWLYRNMKLSVFQQKTPNPFGFGEIDQTLKSDSVTINR